MGVQASDAISANTAVDTCAKQFCSVRHLDVQIKIIRSSGTRIAQRRLDSQSFGAVYSDHMLCADHSDGEWKGVRIEPYAPCAVFPSISGLQYGVSVFEGQKAFRTVDGRIVLFRPRDNYERMRKSCSRMALPDVPSEIYLDGLLQLVSLDADWVPEPDEGSLYLRPCCFSTDPSLRVRPPIQSRFVVYTCAVGQYYGQPLKLLASSDFVRAFPGGTGDVKPGGNYGPTLVAERAAQERGYHSVLWLDAKSHQYVEEAGVMNVFFVIDGKVITPSLTGTVLPGIHRDSVITLLRANGVVVEERLVSMDEIAEAEEAGKLQEAFGTGTAATIAHIIEIGYKDRSIRLPSVDQREVGPYVLGQLNAIRTGRAEDRFNWLVPI